MRECPQQLRPSDGAPVATAHSAAAAALGCTAYNVWGAVIVVARFTIGAALQPLRLAAHCLSGAIHGTYEDGEFSGVASLQAALSGAKAADAPRDVAEEVLPRQCGRTALHTPVRPAEMRRWALGQLGSARAPRVRWEYGYTRYTPPQVDAFLSAMALTHSVVVDTDAPKSAAGIPVYAVAVVFNGLQRPATACSGVRPIGPAGARHFPRVAT